MIKLAYTLNTMTSIHFCPKSSCSFSVWLQERLDGERRTVCFPVSCLVSLLLFMIALWTLSAMCSLYPKQYREGQEFLDVQLFFGDICVSYNFIFWLYNYCYYNNYKDNWWTCMHLSYVCYLAKFMNLFKKRNFFSFTPSWKVWTWRVSIRERRSVFETSSKSHLLFVQLLRKKKKKSLTVMCRWIFHVLTI